MPAIRSLRLEVDDRRLPGRPGCLCRPRLALEHPACPVVRLRLWRTVQAIYIGLFANEVLPLRVGELIRCYLFGSLERPAPLAQLRIRRRRAGDRRRLDVARLSHHRRLSSGESPGPHHPGAGSGRADPPQCRHTPVDCVHQARGPRRGGREPLVLHPAACRRGPSTDGESDHPGGDLPHQPAVPVAAGSLRLRPHEVLRTGPFLLGGGGRAGDHPGGKPWCPTLPATWAC